MCGSGTRALFSPLLRAGKARPYSLLRFGTRRDPIGAAAPSYPLPNYFRNHSVDPPAAACGCVTVLVVVLL
jgi:hypothetical protein